MLGWALNLDFAGGPPVPVVFQRVNFRRRHRWRKPPRSRALCFAARRGRYYQAARGLYRIFNAAEYRFYRSNSSPPKEDDSPFATNASLPFEPPDTFADGTWYLSMSYFNGCLESGFLPLGTRNETYLRLEIKSGEDVNNLPFAPGDWLLELRPGGVVRILAWYYQTDDLRADQWAIAYTTDGSTPPADDPDESESIADSGLAVLSYDLPAQADGTTVKVRLQTRRNDGSEESPDWRYSEGSTVITVTADDSGPSAPKGIKRWKSPLP